MSNLAFALSGGNVDGNTSFVSELAEFDKLPLKGGHKTAFPSSQECWWCNSAGLDRFLSS